MKKKLLSAILLSACLLAPAVNFAAGSSHHPHTKVEAPATAPVNVNTADAKALTALKGIGEKKAEAIVTYRTAHGDFKSTDDLLQVKGISKRILQLNDGKITLS